MSGRELNPLLRSGKRGTRCEAALTALRELSGFPSAGEQMLLERG